MDKWLEKQILLSLTLSRESIFEKEKSKSREINLTFTTHLKAIFVIRLHSRSIEG